MNTLSRESFFALPAPTTHPVDLPALGGRVWVREMSAGERDRFEADHAKSQDKDFRARLIAVATCDEEGKRLFSDADAKALSKLPASAVEPLVRAILKTNALSDDDVADLEKN